MRRAQSLICLSFVALPFTVNAQITSVTGDATIISPPSTVEFTVGTVPESWVFAEQQSVVLSSALAVDVAKPGTYGDFTALPPSAAGTIAKGTEVDSFYLHSYNLANLSGTDFSGSITFATQILGVEGLDGSLIASNSLGNPGTKYYSTSHTQGFDFATNIDGFTWSGKTITFKDETFAASDDLRIITAAAAVPEPATLAFFGLGLAGVGFMRRRRAVSGDVCCRSAIPVLPPLRSIR